MDINYNLTRIPLRLFENLKNKKEKKEKISSEIKKQ